MVRLTDSDLVYVDAEGRYFTVDIAAMESGTFSLTLNDYVAPAPPTGSAVPAGDANESDTFNVLTESGDYLTPYGGGFGMPSGHLFGLAVNYKARR